ncbi:MAG: DUF2997 domain-containing protein [Armatimonadota bacterium]|nr:DUF2997 domain-containing protein [Armatimonadota bacterium]
MELQEVEVIIHPDGRVELQVRGVQGARCLDITKDLEAALGNQIESREMTADALAAPVQEQTPVSAHTGR